MRITTIAKLITEDLTQNRGLESICRLIYESILNEDTDLPQVLATKYPSLTKILSDAGIDIDKLRYVASGDKGAAFTNGEIIVKITEDQKEAMASANLIGLNVPGINHIHSVNKFADEIPYQRPGDEEPIPTQYYMIIQDVLDTKLSGQERIAADAVGDFLSDLPKSQWPFDPAKTLRAVKNHAYRRSGDIISGPTVDAAILSLLRAVTNLFNKYHVKFYDVSSDNVGKNSEGALTIFDLGISDATKVNIPVIR